MGSPRRMILTTNYAPKHGRDIFYGVDTGLRHSPNVSAPPKSPVESIHCITYTGTGLLDEIIN